MTAHDPEARGLEETSSVFRASDPSIAEYIRLVLAVLDIRAAVRQRDPFRFGIGMAELIVLASDRAKAIQFLMDSREPTHTEDWLCPHCSEEVPSTFDLCWNCGTLHFSLQEASPLDEQVPWVDDLTSSMPEECPPSLSPDWQAEIERRSAEIDSGAATTVPWEVVRKELFRRVGL